jgi:nitrogen fixation protein
MNISQVTNAVKVCDITFGNENTHIKSVYDVNLKDWYALKKDIEEPIVYLIVVDGVIMKIGQTESKGGLPRAIHQYMAAGNGTDHTGPPRFAINMLMREQLLDDKSVEFYAIYQKAKPKMIRAMTLFSKDTLLPTSVHAKHVEVACVSEYKQRVGRVPPWNFQEGSKYPQYLKDAHTEYKKNLKY